MHQSEHAVEYYISDRTGAVDGQTVPEVEGGSVHNDVTGQREGLCCEQHAQRQVQRPEPTEMDVINADTGRGRKWIYSSLFFK